MNTNTESTPGDGVVNHQNTIIDGHHRVIQFADPIVIPIYQFQGTIPWHLTLAK